LKIIRIYIKRIEAYRFLKIQVLMDRVKIYATTHHALLDMITKLQNLQNLIRKTCKRVGDFNKAVPGTARRILFHRRKNFVKD